jgi:parallel beta-helix repeat protein
MEGKAMLKLRKLQNYKQQKSTFYLLPLFGFTFIISLFLFATTTWASISTTIVDNSDSGFTTVGKWKKEKLRGSYGGNCLAARNGYRSKSAAWKFTINGSAEYSVYAQWGKHRKLAPDAEYTIKYNGQYLDTVFMDQSKDSGQFNLLGTFWLDDGIFEVVLTNNDSSGKVAADAIMIQFEQEPIVPPDSKYYVSAQNGDDSNSGLSPTEAWRTIQQAADTLQAGDTVYIMAGTYNESVWIENSGSVDNYITYAAYGSDDVVIDGSGVQGEWALLDIDNKSYVRIKGLKVEQSEGPGIWIYGSSNIVIENNYTYNTYHSGVWVQNSSNISINSNSVQLACNGGFGESIAIHKTNHFSVSNNEVFESGDTSNGGEGIDAHSSSYGEIFNNFVHDLDRVGIYIDSYGYNHDIDVYNNTVERCPYGIVVSSESGENVENIFIYQNIVKECPRIGIKISNWGANGLRKNIQITNNKIYDSPVYPYENCELFIQEGANVEDIYISGNVF